MQRTTLAAVKASRIPQAINIPATSQRFIDILNEATQRLLYKGRYWETYGRWTVALSSQWFTPPPEVDTIEKIAEAHTPLTMRGLAYEFNGNGWGTRDTSTPYFGINDCICRGQFPTLADITTPGTLTLKCDLAADSGKTILILGYDENGNWVRTTQSGSTLDGELVALANGSGTNSVTQFSRITGIQAPATLTGQWWLYQGGITGQLLGQYQYWDTNPSWKRYLVPFVSGVTASVEIIGKKAFIPVKNDTDYLVIGNLAALKLACRAVIAEEQSDWSTASLLWNGGTSQSGASVTGALQLLEEELAHHIPASEEAAIELKGSNIGQVEPVPTLL